MKISSATNPRLKQIVKLKDRQARREKNLTVVEGLREIRTAQRSGLMFKEYYVCPEIFSLAADGDFLQNVNRHGTPVYEVTKEIFKKIAFGDRQEGVVALVEPKPSHFTDIKIDRHAMLVVIENVEKPGNLGAILRTCDAAGVAGLLVSDMVTDIYSPNVIRASLGTVFSLAVVQAAASEILSFCKQGHIQIIAASPQAKLCYTKAKLSGPAAFVVGSEQEGLSDFWLQAADAQVMIPMQGHADSLNVSATVAILVYEALRQRE